MVRDQLMQWLKPLFEQGVEIPTMANPFRADIIWWKGDRVMVVEVGIKVSRDDVIPIARAEFAIAPLLKVPPASRGEPRKGSVPPACRGNLKEGVIGNTRFCKLWLRDWY